MTVKIRSIINLKTILGAIRRQPMNSFMNFLREEGENIPI